MVLTYDMIQNITMTITQCNDLYTPSIINAGVMLLILSGLALFSVLFFGIKHQNLRRFVKDNKLEQKYQEWKNNNKGL